MLALKYDQEEKAVKELSLITRDLLLAYWFQIWLFNSNPLLFISLAWLITTDDERRKKFAKCYLSIQLFFGIFQVLMLWQGGPSWTF